ncbi:MAG: DnaJ C-terminal domain-containing protein [Caulobacteraceae bacterium]
MAQDPYSELGVSRGASADEVRRAFRKLAKEFHPDKNPGDKKAEERFKRVSAAFDILGDAEKRKKFDRGEIDADGHEVHRGFGGGGFRPGQGPEGGPWGPRGGRSGGFDDMQFEGVDLNDILCEMFGGRGAAPGARGQRARGFERKGADVRAKLDIDLEDSIGGGKKRIAFSDGRTIDVTIPKGAVDGQVLRLKGQGAPGRGGPGDALIELKVRPHRVYRRDGANLIMDLAVSVPEAVLGAKVQAPTPDGPVTLTVPKGSNSGATLRLKGRGAYEAGVDRRGDLLARLIVTLPEPQDAALVALAEDWAKTRPYSPKGRTG